MSCLLLTHYTPVLNSELATLKPNWQPKADIPSAVPKLPPEYIHRHRLMKQVVNSLLERSGGGPVDTDEEVPVRGLIALFTELPDSQSFLTSLLLSCRPTQ